ncbi:MAG TPA: hypothetical protein VLJ21_04075, partial [Candidatus Binatia bacterium]|nr:hypothetical protein [Candidatus Binatia bacterium]
FDQRNHIAQEISELIKNVKGIRSERDTMTSEVKLSKEEREKLNDDIKKAIADAKKLTAERDELVKKSGVKDDPRFLKRELERLNYKIETEAMSFDKETKLMKVIKDMKKKFDAAKGVMVISDKIRTVSREIDRMKAIAQQAHEKVKTSAKVSQEKHSGMIEVSHKIDELKGKEDEFNTQITAKKAEMQPVGAELDAKAKLLNEVKAKLGIATEEVKQQKAAEQKKKISDKAEEVRAKLMRGEKLTTEDILILQGADK